MGSKYARKVIDKAEKMETSGQPGFNMSSTDGLYRLTYMVYAPENPNGRGVITVELPNKREYNRVRRQVAMRRSTIKFYNKFGEPQLIIIGPNTISVTPEKYEVKKVVAQDGQKKSSIILPNAEAISSIK